MFSECQSEKTFVVKANWSSRHMNIIQRLLKLKVESVGFVPAVPERTTKTADCWVSFPGRQIRHMLGW